MDVIKLTRELGAAIQKDERYLNFAKARQENENDAELNDLMGHNMVPFREDFCVYSTLRKRLRQSPLGCQVLANCDLANRLCCHSEERLLRRIPIFRGQSPSDSENIEGILRLAIARSG